MEKIVNKFLEIIGIKCPLIHIVGEFYIGGERYIGEVHSDDAFTDLYKTSGHTLEDCPYILK